ncbi:uncharacterized protein EI97DRAFT_29773 [Westerdykella ornata]|uniref:Uncharacterized protein n=1 Tax=Westerdykella ornata TaxID=318751 RepID=A0A6A6JZE5_WESOR|nr:uncharacterized protein EI97DRAFT_29773 [Westerdykella ornata]KAF2281453.1 hypothetical protein EI97DRAFT_29773 [Westerdykella ornata]
MRDPKKQKMGHRGLGFTCARRCRMTCQKSADLYIVQQTCSSTPDPLTTFDTPWFASGPIQRTPYFLSSRQAVTSLTFSLNNSLIHLSMPA